MKPLWFWMVFGGAILIQVTIGLTFGADQFHGSGELNQTTLGRWPRYIPRLVRRAEEPEFFWVLIGCQVAWFLVFLLVDYALDYRRPSYMTPEQLKQMINGR